MSVGISMRSRGGSAPPSKGGASSWGAGGPTGAGDGVAPLRSPDVVLKLDAVAEVLKRRQRADVNVPVVGHRGRRLTRSGGRTVAHVGSAAGGRDLARPGVARARTYHAIRYTTMVNQSGAFEPPGRAAHPRVACESFWPSLASPPCPPPPAARSGKPPAAPRAPRQTRPCRRWTTSPPRTTTSVSSSSADNSLPGPPSPNPCSPNPSA